MITRQPTVIPHLVPATPGVAQAVSHHPAAEATSAEAAGENHGSSESETEQPTPRQKKPRRSRTIFTELQLMGLEKKFQKQKYTDGLLYQVGVSWSMDGQVVHMMFLEELLKKVLMLFPFLKISLELNCNPKNGRLRR